MDMPPESTWVPNWKDPNQYPYGKNMLPSMWAWEFLRRNAKYRSLWKGLVLPRMKNKCFIRTDFEPWDKGQFEQEFGVLDTPSPWLSSADFKTKMWWNYPRFVPAMVTARPVGWSVDEEGPYVVENELEGTEALVKFDLRFPLPGQFETVERFLRDRIETLKKRSQLQIFQKQFRSSLYKTYLRLLDGQQAQASLSEMAGHVFPGLEQNKFRVRDSLKAAARLRDYDYRRCRRNYNPQNFTLGTARRCVVFSRTIWLTPD